MGKNISMIRHLDTSENKAGNKIQVTTNEVHDLVQMKEDSQK